MTLTNILPSLRKTIPDPLNADLWPEFTTATTSDVVVAGVSMSRLAELCQTPCVHTAAAVVPGTHGRPSTLLEASAIAVTVTEIMADSKGRLAVRTDATLSEAHAVVSEARLIGRISTAHSVRAELMIGSTDACSIESVPTCELPADLRVGDVLAIPCRGCVALRTIRVRA